VSRSGSSGNHDSAHHGHRGRLKARYLASGIKGFAEHEVLELLLSYSIPRKDTKGLAKSLLKKFGGLSKVMTAAPSDLEEVPGIGEHSAVLLNLVHAVAGRLLWADAGERFRLSSPEALYSYCCVSLGSLPDEQFRAYFLNAQNGLLAEEILEDGTVDQAVVYPRKVLELALKHKAVGLLFAHNHPGGSLEPSKQDMVLTDRLVEAASAIGIKVHDHIIVTSDGYISFHEKNLL